MIIFSAIKQVLRRKGYAITFLALAMTMFFVYILIPVRIIAGNSFTFQLSIFTVQDYITMSILAVLSAVFITLQIYTYRVTKRIDSVGKGGIGGFGTAFASIIGTATCASCLAPLFGFLGIGFGGVIFTIQYRFYFVAGIIGLLLISLYFASKKIIDKCDVC